MDETYTHQLDDAVEAIPRGGSLVVLACTIAADQAAALASDLAQLVGREHSGHTLLLSFDGALDHEIGVEPALGLTEVLSGEAKLAQVAAHGRARGYVFVPAGASPGQTAALLESAAFESLTASAVERAGTVLVFVPPDVALATGLRADGVIWLGAAPDAEGVSADWRTLGVIAPPGSAATVEASESLGGASERAPTGEQVIAVRERGPTSPSRRRERADAGRPRWIVGTLITVAVLSILLAAVIVSRSRRPTSMLPQNDSLWLAPPAVESDTLS